MMEKLEDALSAMKGNMALRLDRIEHRLDSLEQVVSSEVFLLPGPKKPHKTT